jgi:DNA-binding transcriptional MerR regulator/methylmalonyl-CoA mutase cobalamin-binding subunit
MSDLSIDVIRAWERRYGLVEPARDGSGSRLYSDQDVARLSLARAATKLGHPIRRVARMTDEELAKLLQRDARPEDASPLGFVRRIMDSLHEHDAAMAEHLLIYAGTIVPRRELVLDVLAPLLREVGEEWERGTISVWQEHLLSALVLKTTGSLSRIATGEGPILFATPPFEQHEFGILLAEMLAASYGTPTCNLGTGVPLDEIVAAVARLKPAAVVVGMTLCEIAPESALQFAEGLDAELPSDVLIYLGGSIGAWTAGLLPSERVRPLATLEEFNQICSAAA